MKVHLWAPSVTRGKGGIQTYSCEVASALGEMADVTVVTRDTGEVAGSERTQSLSFFARAIREAVVERPDLIWCTHLHFLPAAWTAARFSRSRIAASAHGVELDGLHRKLRGGSLSHADALLPVSRATARRLRRQFRIAEAKITVIPNTADPSRFQPEPKSGSLLRQFGIGPNTPVVLSLGRMHPNHRYKGFHHLLRAAGMLRDRFPDFKLVLGGTGPDRTWLEAQALSLGVRSNVVFAGEVSGAMLPDLFRIADLFAMPSTREGFGIVYLEAMFSGLPVLTGNCGGAPEATLDGATGRTCDPRNTDRLASLLASMLDERKSGKLAPGVIRQAALGAFGPEHFRNEIRCFLSKMKLNV